MRIQKKRKTIPYNFGPEHKAYIRRCADSTYNILEGAVRSGKTIDNVFAFAHELKTTPDRIHLATGSTVANAKLNIGDANGFGLEYIFRGQCRWSKYKDNDALIIKGPSTGWREKIVIFAGGAKKDSYKKIRGNSYGLWIATEINLHHDNTIKEAFNRQLAAKNRKIFWDLNPSNPNASIYTDYIDRYKEGAENGTLLGGYNYEHFTIFDNINIPEDRIQEIISQYDKTSIWYQRDILGERTIAEGLIYSMFTTERCVKPLKEIEPLLLDGRKNRFVSCDYGTQNATVFLLWNKGTDGIWYCIREYYYSGREIRRQKTDSEYADDLIKWLDGTKIRAMIVDPAAASFIAELQKRGMQVQKGDNDVVDGIRTVARLLSQGKIIFSDTCVRTIKEFRGYTWDEEAAQRGEEKPIKFDDHAMDAVRYFCYTILAHRRAKLIVG